MGEELTDIADAGAESEGKGLGRGKAQYIGILAILATLALAAAIAVFWENVRNLDSYGYAGAFVISLLGSATVLVPVPALAVVFALGGVLKYPLLVGIMVGLAEPIGELTGYMAGRGGHLAFKNRRGALYTKTQDWMTRRGSLVLLAMSAVPNPFFDLAGVAAGALRYPLYKFLLVLWAGKTVKGVGVAYAGYFGLRSILSLFGILL
ncbi:MAG TPA: VTT domain-containing protein [Dehalococcoidia bacterium]|nr:VTT domain-containing protein [Dehalococcoidia bacterium]